MAPGWLPDGFVFAAPVAEGEVQRSVVGQFQAARQVEGETQDGPLDGGAGDQWSGGLRQSANQPGKGDGSSSFGGLYDGYDVCLAGCHVHLRQAETSNKNSNA